ncbi:MAG: Crp/Fnr family transcriptional regulator [Gammaproteobacteria bacterium]
MPLSNRLIATLPPRVRNRVLRSAEMVELVAGAVVYEHNAPTTHAYFPRSGLISLITTVDKLKSIEVTLIGNEGMLGTTLLLDIDSFPMRSVVQCGGSAWRLSVPQLRREMSVSPTLCGKLKSYLYVSILRLAHNSACQRFHHVDARLARWLLMTHDRSDGDRFQLTHASLAGMLGVRRSAVTLAAGALRRRKVIRYSRGEITVLSREKLEAESCSCYKVDCDAYTRWLN